MQVLILSDAAFAAHERPLIERLSVGLAGEGVGTAVAIPKGGDGGFSLVTEPVTYSDRGLVLTQRFRAQQIAAKVAEGFNHSSENPHGAVSVVHVFGGSAWSLGTELAEIFGASLAIEIWRGGLVQRAASLRVSRQVPLVLLAPDRPIERALTDAGVQVPVRSTPWGAYAPNEPIKTFADGRDASVVFCSAGRDREGCRAAFAGLCRVLRDSGGAMAFVAEAAAVRSSLWSIAEQYGVLDRVSLIDKLENRRELILRCDMMIYPDSRAEQRSMLLDAFAHGLLVIAAPDPMVGVIQTGVTVDTPAALTAGGWAESIGKRLADPRGSRQLGLAAREYIRQYRRASGHISSLVDAYDWLTSSDAVPFARH